MTDAPDPGDRQGLRFFGSMGAGLSHEFSNVLNIINELAGLQEDIARAAAEGGTGGFARLVDLASRIKSQVARGEELNSSLHRLSHSIDSDDLVFELADVLGLFRALSARAARLAETKLQVGVPDRPLPLQGDPFALLLLLHGCLGAALAAAVDQRDIELTAEPRAGGARLIFSSADPLPASDEEHAGAAARKVGCARWCATVRFERPASAPHRIVVDLAEFTDSGPPAGDHAQMED